MIDKVTIYEFDEYAYYTGTKVLSIYDPIPVNSTTEPIPENVPEGSFLKYMNSKWLVITQPRPIPDVPSLVITLDVPKSITRRQCALELLNRQMISDVEALAMTRNGTPPVIVTTYIQTLPIENQIRAEIDFAAENYYRSNTLLIAMMTANNWSSDDIDDFFIVANKI